MRLPTRRAERLKKHDDGPVYLTSDGIAKLRRKVRHLENDLPDAIAEVTRTAAMGDLSENAAYQIAKANMRRMQSSLFYAKERLKQVVEIVTDVDSDLVGIGSRVLLRSSGEDRQYHIVGPHESDPMRGRISYVSPLGSALLHKRVGDDIMLSTTKGEVLYRLISIQNT